MAIYQVKKSLWCFSIDTGFQLLRIGRHHLKQWLIVFATPCVSSNCVSANHLPLCSRTLPPPITLQTEAFTSGAGFSATRDVVSCLQGVGRYCGKRVDVRPDNRTRGSDCDGKNCGYVQLLQHSVQRRTDSSIWNGSDSLSAKAVCPDWSFICCFAESLLASARTNLNQGITASKQINSESIIYCAYWYSMRYGPS
jgi:hypothetical protein